jgi:YVTN family beta-propeller protein
MIASSLKGKPSFAAAVLVLLTLPTIGAHAQKLVATIPGYAGSMAVNPATQLVYAPHAQYVNVISEKTNTVVRTISVPEAGNLLSAAVNPVTNTLYAGDGRMLFVIDLKTNQVTATVNVPAEGVYVNVATNKIYVSNFGTDVYSIDGRTNNILKDITPTNGVQNLGINPVTNRIYIATQTFTGRVALLDGNTDTITTYVDVGGNLAFGVSVDPLRNLVYVTGQFGTLSVMNGATNTLASTINIGGQPASLVDDPFTQRVYVNNAGLNAIQTIDARTNSIINTVPAGTQPEYSDIDFRTGLLYVENQDPAVLAFRTR